MAMTEEQREIRESVFGEVQSHCPFGCTRDDLDEYGYCRHLVGFTNDGRHVETIQVLTNRVGDDIGRFVSGSKKKGHVKDVLSSDVLVNPERVIKDKNGVHVAKSWVSARVYRKDTAKVDDDDFEQGKTAKKKAS